MTERGHASRLPEKLSKKGLREKVCWRRSIGESPPKKVLRRRSIEGDLPEKVHRRRGPVGS